MTQEISSLMDGELAAPEAEHAIGSLAGDEHKATWYLYHCIGDAMRGQPPRSLERPAVYELLKAQPTVLAPRRPKSVVYARVAFAAAASVATLGVVGWIGSQGGAPAGVPVAKVSSGIQPVANQVRARDAAVQPLDVQAYLAAHRQMPSPELYRPVNNRAPATTR